jgi:hypothetical protein
VIMGHVSLLGLSELQKEGLQRLFGRSRVRTNRARAQNMAPHVTYPHQNTVGEMWPRSAMHALVTRGIFVREGHRA